MSDQASSPWWIEFDKDILTVRETGWGGKEPLISVPIRKLLEDVDISFQVLARGLSRWSNPDPADTQDEDAHERLTNPDRFQLVEARTRAWIEILTNRGWAHQSTDVSWAVRPFITDGVTTVLLPVVPGAVPLVLSMHISTTANPSFSVTVGAGDPAVPLALVPDCACDGCDSGSDALLKDLDMWILSVVDGSLEVVVSSDYYRIRTSFRNQSGTAQNVLSATNFQAQPWENSWTSRPII